MRTSSRRGVGSRRGASRHAAAASARRRTAFRTARQLTSKLIEGRGGGGSVCLGARKPLPSLVRFSRESIKPRPPCHLTHVSSGETHVAMFITHQRQGTPWDICGDLPPLKTMTKTCLGSLQVVAKVCEFWAWFFAFKKNPIKMDLVEPEEDKWSGWDCETALGHSWFK